MFSVTITVERDTLHIVVNVLKKNNNKMKFAPVLIFIFLSLVCVIQCKDLIVGTSFNKRLLWQEKAEYNAIPLKKRVKEVFFSDPGQQLIMVSQLILSKLFIIISNVFLCPTAAMLLQKKWYKSQI